MKTFIITLLILILLPIGIRAQTREVVIPEQSIEVPFYRDINDMEGMAISLTDASMNVSFWYQIEDSILIDVDGWQLQYNADSWYIKLDYLYQGQESWGVAMECRVDSTGEYTIDPTIMLQTQPLQGDVNRDGEVTFGDLWWLIYQLMGRR